MHPFLRQQVHGCTSAIHIQNNKISKKKAEILSEGKKILFRLTDWWKTWPGTIKKYGQTHNKKNRAVGLKKYVKKSLFSHIANSCKLKIPKNNLLLWAKKYWYKACFYASMHLKTGAFCTSQKYLWGGSPPKGCYEDCFNLYTHGLSPELL